MKRRDKAVYYGLSFVAVILAGLYAKWWLTTERLNQHVPLPVGAALFLALTFVMWHRPAMELYGWIVARKMRYQDPADIPKGLKVALITTFVPGSEPIEMLRETLWAMVNADYPHDTWVLDEGDDPEVKDACEFYGAKYFTRKGIQRYNTAEGTTFAARTKGGNHNAWYDAHGHEYDFVVQYDTDFIVERDVLTSVLGYFNDPKVAFVGSPQVYGNVDESWVARGAAEQTYLFYGPVMRGLGDRRQGLLIGANHAVRVAALRDIGWYFAHLAEDLATGMTFHSKGWKSVYTSKPLAIGEGPTTWSAYFTQQYRWAFSCLDLLFRHSRRLVRTMPRRQALRYLWMQLFYLNGLALMLAVGLLMLYFATGVSAASIGLRELVLFYGPLFVWRQLMVRWIQRFNSRPDREKGLLIAGRLITLAALPVYMMAFIGVIRNKRMSFKVTPKGQGVERESLQIFRPHIALAAVCSLGVLLGILLGHTSPVMLAWALCTIVSMLGFSLMTTVLHTRKVSEMSSPMLVAAD